jgi:hypothetical protein
MQSEVFLANRSPDERTVDGVTSMGKIDFRNQDMEESMVSERCTNPGLKED